eukprot:scaffold4151_cov106-Isochrysis_galbana.AAC.3
MYTPPRRKTKLSPSTGEHVSPDRCVSAAVRFSLSRDCRECDGRHFWRFGRLVQNDPHINNRNDARGLEVGLLEFLVSYIYIGR